MIAAQAMMAAQAVAAHVGPGALPMISAAIVGGLAGFALAEVCRATVRAWRGREAVSIDWSVVRTRLGAAAQVDGQGPIRAAGVMGDGPLLRFDPDADPRAREEGPPQ